MSLKTMSVEDLRKRIAAFVPVRSRGANQPRNIRQPIHDANDAVDELIRRGAELRQTLDAYEWLTNGDSTYDDSTIEWRDPCGEGDKDFMRNDGEELAAFIVRAYRDALYGSCAPILHDGAPETPIPVQYKR